MQSRHGDIDGLSAPSAVGNISMFSHCEKQYKENLGRLTRLSRGEAFFTLHNMIH